MSEQRRRYGIDQFVHLLRQGADLPLRTVAAAQAEEIAQAARVGCHHDARGAGVGQHIASVLDRVLFRLAARLLLRHALPEQFLEVSLHQRGGQRLIGALVVLHRTDKLFPRGRDFINLGREDVFKSMLPHIALRLHRERRHAVARDLREQRTGHALDRKGERDVLDRAFVADLGQHVDKIYGLFLGQSVEDAVHVGRGVAVLRRRRDQLFRVGRVGEQFYLHDWLFPFLPNRRSRITISRNFGSFIIRPMRLGCLSRR